MELSDWLACPACRDRCRSPGRALTAACTSTRRTAFRIFVCQVAHAPKRSARSTIAHLSLDIRPRDNLTRFERGPNAAVRATARSRHCPRCADRRNRVRNGADVLFLARADRVVIAADLSRAVAAGSAPWPPSGMASIECVFVETDLHRPGLKAWCLRRRLFLRCRYTTRPIRVRHSAPSPRSFGLAGHRVVGVYNTIARMPLRLRRTVARVTRFRVVPFDPVLRDRRGNRIGTKRGCAISITIPRNTPIRSRRSCDGSRERCGISPDVSEHGSRG